MNCWAASAAHAQIGRVKVGGNLELACGAPIRLSCSRRVSAASAIARELDFAAIEGMGETRI